ncbi:hypothetical protein QBC33DRAFT_324358 [Phialemonium atrogriseum]|uniref:PWI domain-containing protein n=1 Tax=Phialemonium atrogriseum TaxID=1093897 RepID=A0AAJ0FNZ2_9PEZI|nr:uncharacterized protein QBC33DRAFT_324358 [Phialemonium atrogriseum]KAK1769529.1 hypothetical protein QBC33DRAFT_324358 [Phialemonium atrogriseum]
MATGVDARLLKSTKFPPEFNQKVDMQKVNLQVMKKWIAGKVTDILGNEDDVVIELVFNLIEGPRHPDIKSLQIQLTGFLDKDTASFCKDLWKLLLSAQNSPQGVPKELLEAKKLELIQEKLEADKAAEEARQRRDEFERRDRGRGGGGGGQRGGRGDSWRGGRDARDDRDRDYDNRGRGSFGSGRGRSRSPPRYRNQGDRGPPRGGGGDSYVPRGSPTLRRGRHETRFRDNRRRRSATPSRSIDSASSRSRSRSSSAVSRRSNHARSPSPARRRASPSPARDRRTRPRSPSPASRRGRPRSVSSDRASPPPKRRRYSSSRSRSPDRRQKSRSSSLSSSSSRHSRHSRPLSRSRSPRRSRAGRTSRGSRSVSTSYSSRRGGDRRSLTPSSVNSPAASTPRSESGGRGHHRERERGQARRPDTEDDRLVNKISSSSQVSHSRDGSADVSGIEDRPQSSHDRSSASDARQVGRPSQEEDVARSN